MKKSVVAGVSLLALFAANGAWAEERGGGQPSGGSAGPAQEGGAGPERDVTPGNTDRGSTSGSSSKVEQRTGTREEKAVPGEKQGHNKQTQDKMRSSEKAPADNPNSRLGASTESKDSNDKNDTRGASSGAASGEMGKSAGATGESRSSGASHVSVSGEQRTKVQSAFKSHRGNAKVDIHIDARVGVPVPRNVTLIDVPEDVIVIVPEWRHFRYVLIGDQICVVDPDTYEIVDVIEAV